MRVFAGGERDGWRQRAEREKWGKDTVWSESNRWMPVFYKQQEVIVVWLLIWPLEQHGQWSPYTHIRWSWLSYSKTFATWLLQFQSNLSAQAWHTFRSSVTHTLHGYYHLRQGGYVFAHVRLLVASLSAWLHKNTNAQETWMENASWSRIDPVQCFRWIWIKGLI